MKRYTTQVGRAKHSSRPRRESLSKRRKKLVLQVRARDGHRCVYCGATAESSGSHLHVDHLTPKSEGGEDVITNLVLACRSCNSRRQARLLREWADATPELTFTARSIRAHARRKVTLE